MTGPRRADPSILVVGSVALDTVETPFGRAEESLGGSATYFGLAAYHFVPVRLVAVIGDDLPAERMAPLRRHGIDLRGLEIRTGKTFRWGGVYGFDLNERRTLFTDLNVFESFNPEIPETYRGSPFVFLANIDPDLQRKVLRQVRRPRLVACDTMNFWIERKRPCLLRLLRQVDVLLLNDSEARQLSGNCNLTGAARWILRRGPRTVIIKKGEHGAFLFQGRACFFAPAFPLEEVFDPTGAGDSFAGGLLGYLARTGGRSLEDWRRAVIYGSALASFSVEGFSVDRLARVRRSEIEARVRAFRRLTRFEVGPRVWE